MHDQHTGTRDAFLHAYHQERAERRRRRRARLRALVSRRRPATPEDKLAAVAELVLTGEKD